MARASHEVKVRLTAEDRASRDIDKVGNSFGKMKNLIIAGAAAAAAALLGLAKALKSVISAANEQEDAVTKLNAALAPLGKQAGIVSKELQEQAAALQKVTKYGDETIIKGQALIASFTKNTEEIKAATKAALDLSAATGQSLQSAFLLLGRAVAGETSMLSRYGITLDENIPQSEKFAAALAKINEQFGGQAQAQALTFSGIVEQLGNAWGDLKEQVGFAITKNTELLGILTKLRDLFTKGGLVNAVTSFANAVAKLTTNTIALATAVADTVRGMLAFLKSIPGMTTYIQIWTKAVELQVKALAKLAELYVALFGPLKEYGSALREQANANEALAAQEEALSEAFEKKILGLLEATPAIEKFTEEEVKATEAAVEEKEAIEETNTALYSAPSAYYEAGDAVRYYAESLRALAAARAQAAAGSGGGEREEDDWVDIGGGTFTYIDGQSSPPSRPQRARSASPSVYIIRDPGFRR